jgi:hypothetical protein
MEGCYTLKRSITDGTIDWVQRAEASNTVAHSVTEISGCVEIIDNAEDFGTQCQGLKCKASQKGEHSNANRIQLRSRDYAKPLR